jgi:DNA-binding response OmpR family regulator
MASPPTLADVSGGAILIVDDNPDNLALLGNVLRDAGYRVRGAADGRTALRVAAARAPELILLDVQMPEMDGYEVCLRLKADPLLRDIPVIVISALDEVGDKVRAFEVGAMDYVTKPFQAPEVLSRVGSHLQLFRLRRELERKQAALAAQNAELARKNEELTRAEARSQRMFSALAAALPGTVLDGKYRLDEKIGSGGFATVYRGEQLALKRPVAVKVFRPSEANDNPEALDSFRREGMSACRLSHPNAVAVFDCGVSDTRIPYLVMELLEGTTLASLLREGRPLPVERCARILARVCDALAEAHRAGLVHRDVKPDNIFLQRTARGEVVKLLDFGIAKVLAQDADAPAQQTLVVMGTPAYLAPERLTSDSYDGRADVYSVGVVLYQMLSGRLPFPISRGQGPLATAFASVTREAPPLEVEVPAAVAEALARSLAREPERRPTAAELAVTLAALA